MDLTPLEQTISSQIDKGPKSIVGTTAKDLKGVSPQDVPNFMRSPCTALKWLEDNTPYEYETFVRMRKDGCWQGIIAFNEQGNEVAKIEVPVRGGEDGDPMKIIYQNNKIIITETVKYVLSLQE